MKKLLLTTLIACIAHLALGQGYVSFFNTSTLLVSTNSFASLNGGGNPVVAAPVPVGSYYFALMVAPTTQTTVDASLTGWTFSGSYGTNTATAGRLLGYNTSDGTFGCLVNGYGPTATANFVLVGWSANVGTTLQQALTWWNNGQPHLSDEPYNFGISSIATNVFLSVLGGPYNNVMGSSSFGLINGMVLLSFPPIPEPSVFALACLGAISFWVSRRRR